MTWIDDIDEKIAFLKGWSYYPMPSLFEDKPVLKYLGPKGQIQSSLPSYTQSWELAAELLNEMPEVIIARSHDGKAWSVACKDVEGLFWPVDLKLAIARTYYLWRCAVARNEIDTWIK